MKFYSHEFHVLKNPTAKCKNKLDGIWVCSDARNIHSDSPGGKEGEGKPNPPSGSQQQSLYGPQRLVVLCLQDVKNVMKVESIYMLLWVHMQPFIIWHSNRWIKATTISFSAVYGCSCQYLAI